MGRKTSVYLSDELSERMKASGRKHTDLLAAGLDATEAAGRGELATSAEVREIVSDELGAQDDRVRRIVRDEMERATGR